MLFAERIWYSMDRAQAVTTDPSQAASRALEAYRLWPRRARQWRLHRMSIAANVVERSYLHRNPIRNRRQACEAESGPYTRWSQNRSRAAIVSSLWMSSAEVEAEPRQSP